MILNFTIDTDDIYDREMDFESLLTEGLKTSIIKESKDKLASEKFKDFCQLASDALIAEIKLKLENFLSEEIILTGRYGEKDWVGSIEDLIKKRFDDVLLRPVSDRGETIQGCTTSGKTWIEWKLEQELKGRFDRELKYAKENIESSINKAISQKISDMKDNAIKEQVGNTFASILKQQVKD